MRFLSWVLLLMLFVTGCDKVKEQASQAVNTVKKKLGKAKGAVEDGVEKAKQKLKLAGTFDLNIGIPVSINGCYARLHTFPSGRGNVLQIRSYTQPDKERFPSVLFRAKVDAASWSELVGKTVQGELYMQREESGAPMHTSADDLVQFKVESADDKTIKGQFVGGKVVDAKTDVVAPVSGNLNGVTSK